MKKKRTLVILLAVVMVLVLLPAQTTYAAPGDVSFISGNDWVELPAVNGLIAYAEIENTTVEAGDQIFVKIWFTGTATADKSMVFKLTSSVLPGMQLGCENINMIDNDGFPRQPILADRTFTERNESGADMQVFFTMPTPKIEIKDLVLTIDAVDISSDASLKSLSYSIGVSGTKIPVPGFSPTKYNYDVVLPFGTNISNTYLHAELNNPIITGYSYGTSTSGEKITIGFRAEDGITESEYTVSFTVGAFISNDASLSSLKYSVAGGSQIAIPGFMPATGTYDIVLPAGTSPTAMIKLFGTTKDLFARITSNNGVKLSNGTGTANISVIAENGVANKAYKVNFSIAAVKKPVISSIKAGKKNMTIKWKKAPVSYGITKYQVQYREKGTKKWKTKIVSATKSSVAIKNLKKGTQYQVRMKISKVKSGVKYNHTWSKVKLSKKIK